MQLLRPHPARVLVMVGAVAGDVAAEGVGGVCGAILSVGVSLLLGHVQVTCSHSVLAGVIGLVGCSELLGHCDCLCGLLHTSHWVIAGEIHVHVSNFHIINYVGSTP